MNVVGGSSSDGCCPFKKGKKKKNKKVQSAGSETRKLKFKADQRVMQSASIIRSKVAGREIVLNTKLSLTRTSQRRRIGC